MAEYENEFVEETYDDGSEEGTSKAGIGIAAGAAAAVIGGLAYLGKKKGFFGKIKEVFKKDESEKPEEEPTEE